MDLRPRLAPRIDALRPWLPPLCDMLLCLALPACAWAWRYLAGPAEWGACDLLLMPATWAMGWMYCRLGQEV